MFGYFVIYLLNLCLQTGVLILFTFNVFTRRAELQFSTLLIWSMIAEKGFLSNQCKEIEENDRMEKSRDIFKKIGDTKGTFHAVMGIIKDRNYMDLTEAEDIKKRWQEYTEELYKKDLYEPDNHDGVITNQDPDILGSEVKGALGSITTNKASGGDRIPVEIFQILTDDAVKVLHSICQQLENSASSHKTGKGQFLFQS